MAADYDADPAAVAFCWENVGRAKRSLSVWAGSAAAVVVLLLALNAAGIKGWKCEECGDGFFGIAYCGMSGDEIMCRDCAREYWAPFGYAAHAR